MAGLIRREDIETLRETVRIEDVVAEHVSLKGGGAGSLKGLCPFHDERTPSFHVRPGPGLWHCFGCGEGGDVFSFAGKINHLSFVESVEYLAQRYGVQLRYEGGSGRKGVAPGTRQRLLEANRVAQEFYRAHLDSPDAGAAREFLKSRGFGRSDVDRFGVGASPAGWDGLLTHLRKKGFTDDEIVEAGLAIRGNRGPYDRFRNRVMWPIRDLTGATIGFGARVLEGGPNDPKYLNTPETPIYKKSQVLYGLDLAKKDIANLRKVVIVEGYTDVMAAHAAGETTAVATCGTAFGNGHTRVIRRLLGDVDSPAAGVVLSDGKAAGGEVIFTFDGDEAGKKAARRAYVEDQQFAAQTFVAISPEGMDPCDLRLRDGDDGVRTLIRNRVPLFEFVLRSVISSLNLDTPEGRVQGLRVSLPVLAGIKDRALRSEYSRAVAGWLGMHPGEVERELGLLARNAPRTPRREVPSDPVALTERNALAAVMQYPLSAVGSGFDDVVSQSFTTPLHKIVFDAIGAGGGLNAFLDQLQIAEKELGVGDESVALASRRWADKILDGLDDQTAVAVTSLLVQPLPIDDQDPHDYTQGVVRSLVRRDLLRKASVLQARLARAIPDSDEYRDAFAALMEVEAARRQAADPSSS